MGKVIVFLVIALFFSTSGWTQNTYFDWPVPVGLYNYYYSPERVASRPLGVGNHSGEDVSLDYGQRIRSVGNGVIYRYKTDGAYVPTGSTTWCGYGVLYATVHQDLYRPIKIIVGNYGGNNTVEESSQFTFEYGHINDRPQTHDPDDLSTGWDINNITPRNIPIDQGGVIGYVAEDGDPDCYQGGVNDYNGDNEEHLHLGVEKGHVNLIGGYTYETGKSSAYMVIAASRIGVFAADGTHSEPYWDTEKSQAFIDVWWDKNLDGTYKYMDLENYHNKLGRSNNNHPGAPDEGTDFVHKWQGANNPMYRVYAQDFYQPYENMPRFGTDGKSIIILNDYDKPYKARVVKEGFYGYYKLNNGPETLGVAISDEISHGYADSPSKQDYDLIKAGDEITAQKFKRIFEYSGVVSSLDERRTLVWKEGMDVIRFPVGEYSISPDSSSIYSPQFGDQIYIMDQEHPEDVSKDRPWPNADTQVPTDTWFTKGNEYYHFVMHNPDGSRKGGWGITVYIREGNHQSAGDAVYPPESLTATEITDNSVTISWDSGFNQYPELTYNIYRDGNLIQSSQTETVYTDTNLSPNTEYDYYITASLNGEESSPSANLIIRTNETQVSLPEVLVIDSAITKEISNDIPVYESYSYQYTAYPPETYAWALVEIYDADVLDLSWSFYDAAGNYVYTMETARIPLGGNRFYLYALTYSSTDCPSAFGTWEARLELNGTRVYSTTFTVSLRSLGYVGIDTENITSQSIPVQWSTISCATHCVIYRNGKYLAERPIDDRRYVDDTAEPGSSYIYQIAAKFQFEDPSRYVISEFKSTLEVSTLERMSAPGGFMKLEMQ